MKIYLIRCVKANKKCKQSEGLWLSGFCSGWELPRFYEIQYAQIYTTEKDIKEALDKCDRVLSGFVLETVTFTLE